jgi:hypothetical protein
MDKPNSRNKMKALRKELRNWKIESALINDAKRKKRRAAMDENEREMMSWLHVSKPKRGKRIGRTLKRRKEAREWFDHLDFDSSGEIDENELVVPLISMGFAHSVEEVRELISHVDTDGSGEIGFDEFWEILNDKSSDNAFKKLHRALDSGELGDHNLVGVETLLSSYRRKVLLAALTSYGVPKPNEKGFTSREKAKFKRSINALDQVFIRRDNEKANTSSETANKETRLPRPKSLKAVWHDKINRMDRKMVHNSIREEQNAICSKLKSVERQILTVPRTKENCPGKNLYSEDSARTLLALPPPPGAKEMLEKTRATLRREREELRERMRPPPGVNPTLAKLLKTQASRTEGLVPKTQSLMGVPAARESLPITVTLKIDRFSSRAHSINPLTASMIHGISDKYKDLSRFQRRYAHIVQ